MLYHSEYLRDFGAVLEHVAVLRDRPVDVLAFSMGTIMVGEHLRQYPGRKSLIRSCVMDGFISDPASSGAASWTVSSPIRRRASGF